MRRVACHVGRLPQLPGMMHCVVGFCFALTGLAGGKLAEAGKPRIEL